MKKGIIILIAIVIAILAIIAVIFYLKAPKEDDQPIMEAIATNVSDFVEEEIIGDEGKVTTISESSLKEILEISQMSTAEYTYNSIVQKFTEDNELAYSVCYNGIIKAGVDFSEIKLDIDNESRTINVTVPDAKITSVTVEAGRLEYIFADDKYNTETVSSEAYALAVNDLEQKASESQKILIPAKENAISTVKALLNPWSKEIDGENGYEINVK